MKNQYFGDINDYKKYALLRIMQRMTRQRIGFCWMLTEGDGKPEGEIRGYLCKPEKYRGLDPVLFDQLGTVTNARKRDVRSLEGWGLFPGALYHTEMLTDRSDRAAFFAKAENALKKCPIIFFDPDNGMQVPSVGRRRKGAHKYVYFDELHPFYDRGAMLVIYQHFPREERKGYIAKRTAQLREHLPGCSVVAASTAHVGYFIVVPPQQRLDVAKLASACTAQQNGSKELFLVTASSPW